MARHLHLCGRSLGSALVDFFDPEPRTALLFLFRSTAGWTLLSVAADEAPDPQRDGHDVIVSLDVLVTVLDLEREVISRYGPAGWLTLLDETHDNDDELGQLHQTWVGNALACELTDERFRWHAGAACDVERATDPDAAAVAVAALRLVEAGYDVSHAETAPAPGVVTADAHTHACGGLVLRRRGHAFVVLVVARGSTRRVVLADDAVHGLTVGTRLPS